MDATYAVYVRDDAGWRDNCPDYLGVFFGVIPKGARYVHPGESELGGHVEFSSGGAAEAFAASLAESGDWTGRLDGEDRRPTYAVVSLTAAR